MNGMSITQGHVIGRASEVLHGIFLTSQATVGTTKSHGGEER